MKHIISCGNGDAWRRYALNTAHYGAALRRLGLAAEHEERRRAREGFRRGVVKAREEQRHVSAAGRLLFVLREQKSPCHCLRLGGIGTATGAKKAITAAVIVPQRRGL